MNSITKKIAMNLHMGRGLRSLLLSLMSFILLPWSFTYLHFTNTENLKYFTTLDTNLVSICNLFFCVYDNFLLISSFLSFPEYVRYVFSTILRVSLA